MKALLLLLYVAILGHLVLGCATTSAIYQACRPASTDEQQAITDLFARPDLTEAEVIATAEGGKVAICVITEIAKDVLTRASQVHAASPFLASPSPLVARSQAWLKVHP